MKKLSRLRVVGITVSYIGTIATLILALIYMIKTSRSRNNEDATLGIHSRDGQSGILKYGDRVKSTENFSDDYLIGSGTSYMVYKMAIPR